MPKYYVSDNDEMVVIDAASPIIACAKCIINNKFSSLMINGYYRVSERGFMPHTDGNDLKIPSDEANEAAMELFMQNPEEES